MLVKPHSDCLEFRLFWRLCVCISLFQLSNDPGEALMDDDGGRKIVCSGREVCFVWRAHGRRGESVCCSMTKGK